MLLMEPVKRKRRGISWFTLVLCGIIVYFSVILITQQVRIHEMGRQQVEAEARLAAAQKEHGQLLQEKENLQQLPYIEKLAREELGMTRAGELPYRMGRKSDASK